MDPTVTVIIVNYFTADKATRAVDSIYAHCQTPFEIILVDNSCDAAEFGRLVAALGDRVVLIDNGRNAGFGAACNAGAARARGKYLLFFNPDARVLDDSISLLVQEMEVTPELGALGGKLVDDDGLENHSAGRFVSLRTPLGDAKSLVVNSLRRALRRPSDGVATGGPATGAAAPRRQYVDYVVGADLLMRREDFARLGGFDEAFFMYVEENELQYRLRQELRLQAAIDHRARFFHELGGAPGATTHWRRSRVLDGRCRFVHKHHGLPYQLLFQTLTLQLLVGQLFLGRVIGRFTLREDLALLGIVAKWIKRAGASS